MKVKLFQVSKQLAKFIDRKFDTLVINDSFLKTKKHKNYPKEDGKSFEWRYLGGYQIRGSLGKDLVLELNHRICATTELIFLYITLDDLKTISLTKLSLANLAEVFFIDCELDREIIEVFLLSSLKHFKIGRCKMIDCEDILPLILMNTPNIIELK